MFAVVEAFGVHVVEVDDDYLDEEVCLLRDRPIALIRKSLDDDGRAWAVDWLLPRVIAMQPHSQPR